MPFGATKGQIRTQFLAESILLAVIGRIVGVLAGAAATAMYANSKSWAIVDPRRGVTGRHRFGHPDRCVRRPNAGRSSVSDAAYGELPEWAAAVGPSTLVIIDEAGWPTLCPSTPPSSS